MVEKRKPDEVISLKYAVRVRACVSVCVSVCVCMCVPASDCEIVQKKMVSGWEGGWVDVKMLREGHVAAATQTVVIV